MRATTAVAGLAAVLAVAGCSNRERARQQTAAAADTAKAGGMHGMRGTQDMPMRADSLMPAMRAHLDSMTSGRAGALPGMLAAHDAFSSRMLDTMGADMSAMGMTADPAWTALTDSVRQDLAALPGLSRSALEARVRAHAARWRRLLDLHGRMTQRTSGR